MPVFLHAVNHACLILGIIVLFAIIPSLMRGKGGTKSTELPKTLEHM
jgi:hypothetical protein